MDVLQILYRIDATLMKKGISKGDFYSACHISSGAVSQWRTGKTKPSMSTLMVMSNYLGVPYDALVNGTGFDQTLVSSDSEQKEKAPTVLGESFTVDEIIEAYEMAPARVKAAIRSLLGL